MSETAPIKPKQSLFPVLLAAFVDMLGIGLIIPVMAPLIVDNTTGLFGPEVDVGTRNIIYGMMAGLYPLMQFFGAPILGALSDRYGRKSMLILSITGSMAGFALFAIGIIYNDLWLLFVSRALDGFTGGNISIIYSAISDLSEDKDKPRNFGLIGMGMGVGFVIGPFVGGILANEELVSWFGPAMPFWFATLICGINIALILALFKETVAVRNPRPVNMLTGFRNITRAFSFPNLRVIFTVVFLLTLGFSFFTQFFNVFLIEKFDFGETDIGLLFGFIGVCIAVVQGGVVGPISKRFPPVRIIKVSALGLAIVLPLFLIPNQVIWIYACTPFIALFQGLTGPNINTLVSGQARPDQQGQILGINQAVTSLGNAIPPILAGFLAAQNIYLPTLAAAFFTLVAWAVFMFFFSPRKKSRETQGSS